MRIGGPSGIDEYVGSAAMLCRATFGRSGSHSMHIAAVEWWPFHFVKSMQTPRANGGAERSCARRKRKISVPMTLWDQPIRPKIVVWGPIPPGADQDHSLFDAAEGIGHVVQGWRCGECRSRYLKLRHEAVERSADKCERASCLVVGQPMPPIMSIFAVNITRLGCCGRSRCDNLIVVDLRQVHF